MELVSRSWKVMKFVVGKYVCAADLPTVLDCSKCRRENTLNFKERCTFMMTF